MNLFPHWPMMASTGEAVLFCTVAAVMVLGALGVLFFKKAAYAALSMVTVMLGLAVLYVTIGAPFLGTTQVIVYTGAIMMLFLFVIMMIGLGASDEYQSQARGRICAAVLGGLGVAVMLVGILGLGSAALDPAATPREIDAYSNTPVTDLAMELFAKHWFSMELAGALLITAAIGAMLLTHTDKLGPQADQRTMAEAKMRAYKERQRHIGQLPAPGVFATSNAFDVPAISGETLQPVEESVPRVLRVRGLDRQVSSVEPQVAAELQNARSADAPSPFAPGAAGNAAQSTAWGMPGAQAPSGMKQPESYDPAAPQKAEASLAAADDAAATIEQKEAGE